VLHPFAARPAWQGFARAVPWLRLPGIVCLLALALAGRADATQTTCGNPACTQVAGLSGDAFSLGTWNGAAVSLSTTLNHCVFSNRPNSGTRIYSAVALGEGTTGGAFVLSGPGGTLPYQVELADGTGGSVAFTVMTTAVSLNLTALTGGSGGTFDSCTNSPTNVGGQQVRLTVFGSDMLTRTPGDYTGTMRITATTTTGGTASSFQLSGTIKVTIPGLVRLSGLQSNLTFGTWNPDAGVGLTIGDASLCVWSNNVGGGYSVTASASPGATFALQQPGQPTIPYEVYWAASAGVSGTGPATQLTHNLATAFAASAVTTDCSGGSNTSLVLRITDSDLAAAKALVTPYTSVLTLTVGQPP